MRLTHSLQWMAAEAEKAGAPKFDLAWEDTKLPITRDIDERELVKNYIHNSLWLEKHATREIRYPSARRSEVLPHRMTKNISCPITHCGPDWDMDKQEKVRRAYESALIKEGGGLGVETFLLSPPGYNIHGQQLPQ